MQEKSTRSYQQFVLLGNAICTAMIQILNNEDRNTVEEGLCAALAAANVFDDQLKEEEQENVQHQE